MHKRLISSGFTLIELLITLAIMSLLVGMVIPNYQHNILATQRDLAKMKLTTISLLQTDNFSRYQEFIELENLAIDLSSNTYQYSIDITESNHYTVIATAVGSQLNDINCRQLSLDHNLMRLPAACW